MFGWYEVANSHRQVPEYKVFRVFERLTMHQTSHAQLRFPDAVWERGTVTDFDWHSHVGDLGLI